MRTATTNLICLLLASFAILAGCAPGSLNDSGSLAEMAFPEAVNGPSLTSDQHTRLGDRMAADGRGEAAFLHYQKALALLEQAGTPQNDPSRLNIQVRKGMLLLSDNQNEAALSEFQGVLALAPDHAAANEGAGAVYLKSGLLAEAQTHLERAAGADQNLWRTHQLLGVLYSRRGDLDRAVQELNASLALSPGQSETLNNLGVARLTRGEYTAALEHFRQALRAGAPKARTYNNIGLTLARMGHRAEALEAFKYAGDEARAYNNLGYVLLLQGETDAAVECFEKAVALSPSYYAKAFENLKQARMARSFLASGLAAPRTGASTSDPVNGAAEAQSEPLTEENLVEVTPSSQSLPATIEQPVTNAPLAQPIHFESALPTVPAAIATAHVPVSPNATIQTAATLWGYHLASFKRRDMAEGEAARFAAKGLETDVIRVDLGAQGVWHRVMVGRYPDHAAARAGRTQAAAQLGMSAKQAEEELFIQSFENPERTTPPDRRVL